MSAPGASVSTRGAGRSTSSAAASAGAGGEVSTGKHTLDEARVELAVFLRNPASYASERTPLPPAPATLDAARQVPIREPVFLDAERSTVSAVSRHGLPGRR